MRRPALCLGDTDRSAARPRSQLWSRFAFPVDESSKPISPLLGYMGTVLSTGGIAPLALEKRTLPRCQYRDIAPFPILGQKGHRQTAGQTSSDGAELNPIDCSPVEVLKGTRNQRKKELVSTYHASSVDVTDRSRFLERIGPAKSLVRAANPSDSGFSGVDSWAKPASVTPVSVTL